MGASITADTKSWHGKRIDSVMNLSLPYSPFSVALDCRHSPLYVMQNEREQPPFCGLCFFREGYEAELPKKIHAYKTLAENGNPEASPKFLAHLRLVMGFEPPRPGESLKAFNRRRNSSIIVPLNTNDLAREQYTRPARRLFPVASSIWKLMGYQPPLAIVLVGAVTGKSEGQISKELDLSRMNVHIRMAKAIRTAMGYIIDGEQSERSNSARSFEGDLPAAELN